MTSVGRVGGEGPIPPIFTGPVITGVPGDARIGGAVPPVTPVPPVVPGTTPPVLPDVALAGRLAAGDVLPDAAALALALEQATRALQGGRAHEVLATLDATWSSRLAADSPWYLRAAALELLARRDDAAGVLREALARLPRSAALLYLLGVHAVVTGDTRAADVASDHAIALHPDDPVLLVLRAAVETRLGRTAAAASHLARAEARAPSLPVRDWLAGLVRLATSAAAPPRTGAPTPAHDVRTTRLPTPTTLRALAAGGTADTAPVAVDDVPAAMRRAAVRDDTTDDDMRTTGLGDDALRAARRDDEPATSARARRAEDPRLPDGLHDAVRYGLALLDAPAVAARAAVRHRTLDEAMPAIAAQAGLVVPPVPPSTAPSALALVGAAAVLLFATMPSARTFAGVCAAAVVGWWWWRRRARRRAPVAREPLPERVTTVDRRIA